MSQNPNPDAITVYQLRVTGHLDQCWSSSFSHLRLSHDDDGSTSLTGPVADQAELHGLLTKIRDLGVTLISLAVLEPHGGRHVPS